MDIEQKEQSQKTDTKPKVSKKVNRDLLRFERPIYQIKKSNESEQQYVIRKLMDRRSKPEIGIIQKSPLLARMKEMMPIFKQSNEELFSSQVKQQKRIDLQLQEVEESSSSDSDEEQNSQMVQQDEKPIINVKPTKIKNIQSFEELQINILRYPYAKETQKKQQDDHPDEEESTDPNCQGEAIEEPKAKPKIVQIGEMVSELDELE